MSVARKEDKPIAVYCYRDITGTWIRTTILLYRKNSTAALVGLGYRKPRWYKIREYADGSQYILFRQKPRRLDDFLSIVEGNIFFNQKEED